MRKFNHKAVCIALIGAMLCMSGCGASTSDGPTAELLPDEKIVEVVAASETQQEEPETKKNIETEVKTTAQTVTETEVQTDEQLETKLQPETVNGEEPKEAEPAPAAEGSVSNSDYAVTVKGVTIPLGGDMRDYVGLLGEPDDYGAAKSCTDAGDDKVYTYGGTVIYTYITNDADIISLIEITGSEALSAGIHVGSTKEEVIAAYGSAYTEDGNELLYEMGDKIIGLQITDNKVSFMELFGE